MRLTSSRLGVVVLVGVLALGGCGADRDPDSDPLADVVAPTGAPVSLEPLESVDGEVVTAFGALGFVMPDGFTEEPTSSQAAGGEQSTFRMPDANADGLPALQVTYQQTRTGGSQADSLAQQSLMKASDAVSDFERSAARWPGAEDAVISTWTEEVPTDGDPVVVDCLALWVDIPDGGQALAMVIAPTGRLDGSSALQALRTLTID